MATIYMTSQQFSHDDLTKYNNKWLFTIFLNILVLLMSIFELHIKYNLILLVGKLNAVSSKLS